MQMLDATVGDLPHLDIRGVFKVEFERGKSHVPLLDVDRVAVWTAYEKTYRILSRPRRRSATLQWEQSFLPPPHNLGAAHRRSIQRMAIGLIGEPVPRSMRNGAATKRNAQRPASSQAVRRSSSCK
jgi:hypothetical protein